MADPLHLRHAMDTLFRLLTLIRKELQVILADPQSRRLVIVPVLLQALLFPFAATLEVKNTTLAVHDEDGGSAAVEIVQRLAASTAFTAIILVTGDDAAREVLDRRRALGVLRLPPDFTRCVESGQPVSVQLLLDGRASNSSQIAGRYIQEVLATWQAERVAALGRVPLSELVVRHRYNSNLDYQWFILPSLVAIILSISALILSALSVAREREQGTFDQLRVSPLTPEMILLGKAAAALVVGLFQATVIIAVAVFFYRVPLHGSLPLVYVCSVLYFTAMVGVGLLISALASTQQQAFLGAFAFMVPAALLSGFAAPVENMPDWLRILTWPNPLRHAMVLVKSLFLKDVTPGFVLSHAWPLALVAVVTVSSAAALFRRRAG